ncbi:MAG: MATE family efflux transporter [Sandaracinaceae bacterium]
MGDEAERRRQLLEDPVGPTLLRLTLPMMLGIGAILFFNVVDTFWVGQLGPTELAAMGFTFPVSMIVSNLTMGISIGATAVIARAVGEGHRDRVRRLTTDSLVLSVLIVVSVSGLGLLTIDPLFRALGANHETLPPIRSYMVPWYLGIGLLVVPMVGNGAIRATGDTRMPSLVMVAAGLVNAVLDPLLIFGWGPVPALGLTGAALATVGSYGVAMALGLYLLASRGMLTLTSPAIGAVLRSWQGILRIGLPAAGTNLLTPVAGALVTRIVAGHGQHPVAAYGVGTRVEGLAMIGVFALTAAITPFVGQNLGANKAARIRETLRFCVKVALGWGLASAAILAALAWPLARVFNDDPEVVAMTVAYLRTVPLSYGLFGLALLVAAMFNAMDAPLKATLIAFVRLIVLAVPLAWFGSVLFGVTGIFLGIGAANLVIGGVAWRMGRAHVGGLDPEHVRGRATSRQPAGAAAG